MKDEKQKPTSESPVINDHIKKLGTGVSGDLPTIIDVHQQPDHLLSQQSYDNKLLQYDKSKANGSSTVAGDHDYNDLTAGSAGTVEEAIVVKPSMVDATMPLILKYSRESEEKPSDVQPYTVNHDDMSSDESLLLTCEFCGAEINPDFTPVHNKDNNDSSDSEEVNGRNYITVLSFLYIGLLWAVLLS